MRQGTLYQDYEKEFLKNENESMKIEITELRKMVGELVNNICKTNQDKENYSQIKNNQQNQSTETQQQNNKNHSVKKPVYEEETQQQNNKNQC